MGAVNSEKEKRLSSSHVLHMSLRSNTNSKSLQNVSNCTNDILSYYSTDYKPLSSWMKITRRYHGDWACQCVAPRFADLKDLDYMLEAYAILAMRVKVVAHEINATLCFWTSGSSP